MTPSVDEGNEPLTFSALSWRRTDDVVTVLIDRPPVNALNIATYREIERFFSSIEDLEPGVRALVFGGAGPHFSVGRDLKEGGPPGMSVAARNRVINRAATAVRDCPIPVVAAIHGTAVGGGLGLPAACDLILAAEGTLLGLPEIRIGLMGGASFLARLAPPGVVRWMFYSCELVPVEDLAKYGGILKIVPRDRLHLEAEAVAQRIATSSGAALRYGKHTLNAIEYLDLDAAFRYEQRMTLELSKHPDSLEARTAFVEKREPRFES